MSNSTNLYPCVTVTWSSTNTYQLELTCDNKTTTIAILPLLSYNDIVLYVKDAASSKDFEKFSISISEHTEECFNKKTGTIEILEKK